MEVNNNLRKIKLLLQYLFEGKIVLNENYSEKLLKFLENRDENSPGKLILDSPSFSDLIFHSLENINNASTSLKVFIIEIVTILFKNELQFIKMQAQGFQNWSYKLSVLGSMNGIPPPPDLHLACIKLATVQISHCSGLNIIIQHKVWRNILYPNIHLRPKQISNAVYNFMSKLIWKLNEYNLEPQLLEVLEHLMMPLLSSGYLEVPVMDAELDAKLSDTVFTHISALSVVLNEVDKGTTLNKVMSVLNDYYKANFRLHEIFNATKHLPLLKLLNTCLFRYYLASARHLFFDKKTEDFCNAMTTFYRNFLVHAMGKREVYAIIDFIVQANIMWSDFEKAHAQDFDFPLTFERGDQKFDFSLQIIIQLLVPMLKYAALHRIPNPLEMNEVVEMFVGKMARAITDYIYSCCFTFMNILEEGGPSFRNKVTTHTLKELLRLKGHINESQAGLVFQSLYYLLEIFILSDEEGELVLNENPMDQDDLRLLSHLLDAMKMLLKEHNIPWYDNLEVVSVKAGLLNLLKQNRMMSKQVVQVLDLIDICVRKFLSPDMSLLVESKCAQGSTLNEIGAVMRLYTQHEDWEVRDSAFNLLNSCIEICFIKYAPLQKVIRENSLIIIAAKAGFNDPEFYPQCAALKCLAAATKIEALWQEALLDNPIISYHLIYTLKNHAEGMVRKQVASVLCGIYEYHKIQQGCKNVLYKVMMCAALDELHWEVQLAALDFWKQAIHNNLTYRGMLDGKFPSVTFSKEKRKIIVLNDKEIHNQLAAVLNDLSSIGCLTVLVACMDGAHHNEVINKAYGMTKELIAMLDRYKFDKVPEHLNTRPMLISPKRMEEDPVPINLPPQYEEERNKVIDGILKVNLSELIMNLHDNSYKAKSEEMEVDFADCPPRELVHPNKFLEVFRNNDFTSFIEDNKYCYADCISTLDGLLNEILGL